MIYLLQCSLILLWYHVKYILSMTVATGELSFAKGRTLRRKIFRDRLQGGNPARSRGASQPASPDQGWTVMNHLKEDKPKKSPNKR